MVFIVFAVIIATMFTQTTWKLAIVCPTCVIKVSVKTFEQENYCY